MAYVGANRKEIVNFYLYTPLLLLILQSAGNSGYIKNLIYNWIKLENMARLVSLALFVGLAFLIQRTLKHLGVILPFQVPPPTTLPSLPLPSPFPLSTPLNTPGTLQQLFLLPPPLFPWHPYHSLVAFWPFFNSQFLKEALPDHSIKYLSLPRTPPISLPSFFFFFNNYYCLTYYIDCIFCLLALFH